MQADRIKELQEVIEEREGCKSKYIESVPVTEMFQDMQAWTGEVGVFELSGHRKAKRAYAWNYHERKEGKMMSEATVVLEIPPVDSAKAAVKTAIAAKARRK
jgi:hypothetical protein